MFEWIFLWLIIHQFVKFVVFITLLHKKSIVNSKLKLVIEKKKEQWNGWRRTWWDKTNTNYKFGDKSDMIWYMGEDFFFPTFLVLRVYTCIKAGVFFWLDKVPKNSS